MRDCLTCGHALALTVRADALYCSGRCRVAAHRRRPGFGTIRRAELERLVDAVGPLAEARLLAGIQQAARDDWRAGAWVLSRRWPERWGQTGSERREQDDVLAE